MAQRTIPARQMLREHLEDALVEAEASDWTAVAAIISEALDALDAAPDPKIPSD
jgi:hypothetical protein